MPAGRTARAGVGRTHEHPDRVLHRVDALARNLWWTWNPDPQRLFAALDPVLWEAINHNPIAVLARLSPERAAALQEDPAFLSLLRRCELQWAGYLAAKTWFQRTATPRQEGLYQREGKEYRPELLLQPEDIASVVVNAVTLPGTAEVTDISIRPMLKSY